MKVRFAVLSAIFFWLYAITDFAKNALETVVHSRLIESMAGFSSEDYAIDVSSCQRILLIVGIVFLCFFIADVFIDINTKRKSRNKT